MQVRGYGLGGFEGQGFGDRGVERLVVFVVRGSEVWGFGYVVSQFKVFKVRGFAYVVRVRGFRGSGFRLRGFRGSGFRLRGFSILGFGLGVLRFRVSGRRFSRFGVSGMGFRVRGFVIRGFCRFGVMG